MKIIIPNAKELNTNLNNQSFQELPKSSKQVLASLVAKSPEELASFYKISEEKALLEWDRWQRIKNGQAKTYPAWQLYDGLMYRYMDRRDLTSEEEDYLRKTVRLATGLYGLIQPFEGISPHRLDFQSSLKIGKQSLKQFWRPYYDQEVKQEKYVLSLASSEFEQVFSPSVQSRLTRVIFKEEKNGQLKVHSTISKKGRGRLLSWMVKHQINDLDKVKLFDLDGFSFDSTNSRENLFLFIRKQ
ncbi:TPA: peroxide stress protein YaaA [Streptococcus suis]|nr:peroxide stress protein YaaA [Streptococcus suis]